MTTYTIAVCDDDEAQLRATAAVLRQFASERNFELQVYCYTLAPQLLFDLNERTPDLVFIDIEFDGKPEGIAAVREINERVPNCQVVYLTNYLQYAVDVYQANHV